MGDMKLAVMGASGRMGRTLTRLVHEMEGCVVAGGTEAPGSEFIGADLGELAGIGKLGIAVTDDPIDLFVKIDGVLDFTSPMASLEFAALSAQARIVHVIGTTGFTPEQEAALEPASRHCVIIREGNMSLGVNLLTALTKKVAAALDDDFDIEILEMHHKHKVDAPSGTALMLGRAAADGRHVELEHHGVFAREGQTGARRRGDIGFAALRGGSVVGDHSVIFAGEGEMITLSHQALDRAIFARGAIKAALWGRGKDTGIYSMADVLGLS